MYHIHRSALLTSRDLEMLNNDFSLLCYCQAVKVSMYERVKPEGAIGGKVLHASLKEKNELLIW